MFEKKNESSFILGQFGPVFHGAFTPSLPLASMSGLGLAGWIPWDFFCPRGDHFGAKFWEAETDKSWKNTKTSWWFFTNPFEKYARQIGSFPQGSGWKLKMFELPPPSKSNGLWNPYKFRRILQDGVLYLFCSAI